jgi:1,4-dihydroxy-2-naphthoate octaprenyltransferase
MINDYFDVKHSVDVAGAPTTKYRPHPLVARILSPSQVLTGSLVLYVLTVSVGFYLVLLRGVLVLLFGFAGLFVSLFYTADPVRLNHRALGELSVFMMWGPLMTSGSYLVQTGQILPEVVLVSIPIGTLVALVLLANNTRDITYDGSVGVKTIPVLVGRESALDLYLGLIAFVYLLTASLVLVGILPVWGLLVFLSLPKALGLASSFRDKVPDDADPLTAQLTTMFGALLILGLVISMFFPLMVAVPM